MSNQSPSGSTSGGIGLGTLLTVIFVVLKLTGNISWPWIWVLAPVWISTIFGFASIIAFLIASKTLK